MPPEVGPAWRDAVAAIGPGDEVHQLVLALADGVPVGGARMTLASGGALLGGAAVLGSHRGLGIQRALIRYRARLAIEAGATWLAATSRTRRHLGAQPGPDGLSARRAAGPLSRAAHPTASLSYGGHDSRAGTRSRSAVLLAFS